MNAKVGAQLVGQAFVFAAATPLKPNETRLLLWMCLHALDSDQPPRYFAARESSALGLGRRVPDAPDPLDPDAESIEASREAAFQRVKIATRGLVEARAIKRLQRGREGTRAEFVITLDGLLANFGRATSTQYVPLQSTQYVPPSGSEYVPRGVRNTYPLGTTDDYKEPDTGKYRAPALTHVRPVENANRLPTDWAPTSTHFERAKAASIDIAREVEAFKLHAETHDRHAVNWNSAFTTWLTKAKPTTSARVLPKNEWMLR